MTFELVEDEDVDLLELELLDFELVKGLAAGWKIAGSDEVDLLELELELLEDETCFAACACGAEAAMLCLAPEEVV